VFISFYSGFLCAQFILLSNYVCYFNFAQDVYVLTLFSAEFICAQLILLMIYVLSVNFLQD